ncbi:hypothetical protein [Nannocystis sp.]|uniref:hypothetical protein n=1 Tax=Nannocystis sp. TaxID=1962667 RepID=UPI0025D98281|nr:hypothetical protein [Nannocystis sp.]
MAALENPQAIKTLDAALDDLADRIDYTPATGYAPNPSTTTAIADPAPEISSIPSRPLVRLSNGLEPSMVPGPDPAVLLKANPEDTDLHLNGESHVARAGIDDLQLPVVWKPLGGEAPTPPSLIENTTLSASATVPKRSGSTKRSKHPVASKVHRRPASIDLKLRAELEAKVSWSHSVSSGFMVQAGLNSEHILPQSVIKIDWIAHELGFKPGNSPTIWIDEELHQSGITYGKGWLALLEFDTPLRVVDAVIADYTRLLDTPRFARLSAQKAKYLEGFEAIKRRYISQFPEVFDAKRSPWWADPED